MVETSARNLGPHRSPRGRVMLWLVVSWLWVALPLAWGVWQTAIKSRPLFDSFLQQARP